MMMMVAITTHTEPNVLLELSEFQKTQQKQNNLRY